MQQTLADISLKMCIFWDNMQSMKSKKDAIKRKYVSRRGLMNELELLLKTVIGIIDRNKNNQLGYLADLEALLNDCDNDW